MGIRVNDFVAKLSDNEKLDIIASYEQFEIDGYTGDSPVRQQTMRFLEELGISPSDHIISPSDHIISPSDHITMWMREVSRECYVYFARKHLMSRQAVKNIK